LNYFSIRFSDKLSRSGFFSINQNFAHEKLSINFFQNFHSQLSALETFFFFLSLLFPLLFDYFFSLRFRSCSLVAHLTSSTAYYQLAATAYESYESQRLEARRAQVLFFTSFYRIVARGFLLPQRARSKARKKDFSSPCLRLLSNFMWRE
jgi:hypothetical protein